MPSYKLSAFNARFQIEPARMLFALKGQSYEDVRYEFHGEDWQKVKHDKARFPFAQLPVLEVDGRVLTQSKAIFRFLAREFGYYGSNNVEDSEIDVICELMSDIETCLGPVFVEQDAEKRTAYLVKSRDTKFKLAFDFFADSLQKTDGKHVVSNRITLADLAVFDILGFFLESKFAVEGYFDSFPTLLAFYEFMKTDSPLASYIKNRPQTVL